MLHIPQTHADVFFWTSLASWRAKPNGDGVRDDGGFDLAILLLLPGTEGVAAVIRVTDSSSQGGALENVNYISFY